MSADTVAAEEELQHRLNSLSLVERRALELLGNGHSQEIVASTLGVTPGRITQYLSQDWYAAEVSKLKYAALRAHTDADKKVDRITDKILDKIEKSLPLMHKTGELIKAFQVLNGAKRRGAPSDTTVNLISNTVVNLTLPTAVVNKYKTNSNAQVIEVNDKPFLTAPSNMLPDLAKQAAISAQAKQIEEVNNAADSIREIFTSSSRPLVIKGQTVCAEDL